LCARHIRSNSKYIGPVAPKVAGIPAGNREASSPAHWSALPRPLDLSRRDDREDEVDDLAVRVVRSPESQGFESITGVTGGEDGQSCSGCVIGTVSGRGVHRLGSRRMPTTGASPDKVTAGSSGGLVLALNSGSSSVKFALMIPANGERRMEGIGERLGTPEAMLRVQWFPAVAVEERLPGGTHRDVIARVLDQLAETGHAGAFLLGAGHRVVHGGERFTSSVRVDDAVVAAVASLSHLAPLHNPANLAGIEAVRAVLPDLPQVAVFDTAFHQTMPPHAFRYAVPEDWYTRHGVRRYGFHGISHRFVSEQAASLLGRPPTELRLVTAHLGNGCSATAVRDGVSVDTTMGLTPLEGLVMGTRSGDVDPGLLGYLAGRTGMNVDELTEALNLDSGLQGLSGVGNDMRAVVGAASDGNARARLALEVFVHRLSKAIAGLVVGLQRLDALVFTGGIGENSAAVRSLVLGRLGFLGLAEDVEANANHGRHTGGRISLAGPVLALVVPTDEELLIARDTARVIAGD
jgi:acetate kinase